MSINDTLGATINNATNNATELEGLAEEMLALSLKFQEHKLPVMVYYPEMLRLLDKTEQLFRITLALDNLPEAVQGKVYQTRMTHFILRKHIQDALDGIN